LLPQQEIVAFRNPHVNLPVLIHAQPPIASNGNRNAMSL
jgi:hypothetical protein